MNKNIALALGFLMISLSAFSQRMSISGNIQDTVGKTPLPNAVAMAVRIRDSTLIAHTRTDANGSFTLKNLPIDTVEVIISHFRFGDKSFFVFGSAANNVFDFGKIVLPPKSQQLKEVVIYAFKDPVYYKGDTLIYTADSFKVKPNATVEDLLKKLPGIKVDAQGKITAQGEAVDQVLVDGDEFFGTDPTMATKNLNANSLESVQVYDKKNESTGDNDKETLKVMNLKLKEDAKKGYFGKVTGGSDFQKFYEGELLANKFNNKQKISVFALSSNTPRANFDWSDLNKYGVGTNNNYSFSDEEGFNWNNNEQNRGIPQTLKTGVYYTDKISKKTKLTFNYTYDNNVLKSISQTRSQYFLTDTSYVTSNDSKSQQKQESHSANFSFTQQLDSLTELELQPKLKLIKNSGNLLETNDFLTNTDTLDRRTTILNKNEGNTFDLTGNLKLKRNFKKKDRQLVLNYKYSQNDNVSEGLLQSSDQFYRTSSIQVDSIDQKKNNESNNQSHNASVSFTEPITKKLKIEFSYDYIFNAGSKDRKTLKLLNGEYTLYDSLLTNDFANRKNIQRGGIKFTYEVKKQRLAIGARVRHTDVINTNLMNGQKAIQNVNNLLPHLNYTYRFSDNQQLRFQYTTKSNLPGIEQLQPIPDNSNPNRIKLGNPDLLPTFNQDFNLSFNSYKPISGKYIWTGLNLGIVDNAFTNAITYDSIGRTITQPVNVNGNYQGYAYLGGGLPMFSKILQLNPSLNFNYSNYTSLINGKKSITKSTNTRGELEINVNLDTLEFRISGNYTYNYPIASLNPQSNKPYTTQNYNVGFRLRLPAKFLIESEITYTVNDKRASGYNINYAIWDAALRKTFLKNENLVISIEANDILNQNISTNRTFEDNIITDTKTNIISRYILFKALFKFNNSKTKETDDF